MCDMIYIGCGPKPVWQMKVYRDLLLKLFPGGHCYWEGVTPKICTRWGTPPPSNTRNSPPLDSHLSHTIHVWYIYLHLVDF